MVKHFLRLIFASDMFQIVLAGFGVTMRIDKRKLNSNINIIFKIETFIDLAETPFPEQLQREKSILKYWPSLSGKP
jgi:hypothetical protein